MGSCIICSSWVRFSLLSFTFLLFTFLLSFVYSECDRAESFLGMFWKRFRFVFSDMSMKRPSFAIFCFRKYRLLNETDIRPHLLDSTQGVLHSICCNRLLLRIRGAYESLESIKAAHFTKNFTRTRDIEEDMDVLDTGVDFSFAMSTFATLNTIVEE